MTAKKLGRQTAALAYPPSFAGHANVVGKKEGQGPLAASFDFIGNDDTFGEATWEKSEQAMQKQALALALDKAGQPASSLDWLFAGDLLNQCISSSFAARGQDAPYFGLYGACSTMGEGLALAAMLLDGGFGAWAGVVASSHFCSAERQYRNPLEYGAQRAPTTQWTATAAGAAILAREGPGPYLTHVTAGKIVDRGITDTNNMGAAMAPAAYETLKAHFQDTGRAPEDYDLIVTGDLEGWAASCWRSCSGGTGWSWPPGTPTAACSSTISRPRTPTAAARAAGAARRCSPGTCSTGCGPGRGTTSFSAPPGPSTPPPPPSRRSPSPASVTP